MTKIGQLVHDACTLKAMADRLFEAALALEEAGVAVRLDWRPKEIANALVDALGPYRAGAVRRQLTLRARERVKAAAAPRRAKPWVATPLGTAWEAPPHRIRLNGNGAGHGADAATAN